MPTLPASHGVTAQLALGDRDVATHEVPPGEAAKTRPCSSGSGARCGSAETAPSSGSAAAAPPIWPVLQPPRTCAASTGSPVPTSLVGQVDAAIGGKTAIDLPEGKNLVGAFHWPARVIIDPGVLETLAGAERGTAWPRRSRRASSQASRCGSSRNTSWYAGALRTRPAFACAIPTIAARATSSISGTRSLTHWRRQPDTGCRTAQAVALGMVAALRLSGNEEGLAVVRKVLAPKPVKVDRDAAWAALARDKKARAGSPRLVLLEPGAAPRWGVEVPAGDVRAALDDLIAD